MTAEYLIHFSDGSTDGPYTEEDILDMVDADELSAGAVCEDIATGRRMRVRQLFQVIKPADDSADGTARPAARANPASKPGLRPLPPAAASPAPGNNIPTRPATTGQEPAGTPWVPAPLPKAPVDRVALAPPVRTYYQGSPSLLSYPVSLTFSLLLTAGGWYAGRWDGNYLAGGWIAGCAFLALTLLRRSAADYRVTSRRVEARIGLFSKSSKEIRISDIRSINVTKTGLSGFLSVGTVIFSSSGGTEEDVVFRKIWRAHSIKDLVRLLQDRP